MKSSLNLILLTCLLSLFVFGDLAMAQPWRNPNATAQSRDIYYNGVKLGVDTPTKILKEAMEKGYSDDHFDATVAHAARFYYAQCQVFGYNGVPKDEKEAEKEFRLLFDCINIGGTNIGRWTGQYAVPVGRNQRAFPPSVNVSFNDSMVKYIESIRKKAEQGNTEEQIKLGMYYTLAMGVPSDPRESVKWIRRAADQGNAEAQIILADFYAEGYGGLPVSRTEYEKWVRRAASQGNFKAQHMVESMRRNPGSGRSPGFYGVPSEPPSRGSTPRVSSANTSRYWRLTPGDVILTVNGESITGMKSLTAAVNRSPQTMRFTVRDGGRGKIYHFETTLASTGYRFGVYSADNPGGGAKITSVMPNSAATRCVLVE